MRYFSQSPFDAGYGSDADKPYFSQAFDPYLGATYFRPDARLPWNQPGATLNPLLALNQSPDPWGGVNQAHAAAVDPFLLFGRGPQPEPADAPVMSELPRQASSPRGGFVDPGIPSKRDYQAAGMAAGMGLGAIPGSILDSDAALIFGLGLGGILGYQYGGLAHERLYPGSIKASGMSTPQGWTFGIGGP